MRFFNSSASTDIVIIGGGFSGIALLYQLFLQVKSQHGTIRCILFEPKKILGAGIAYGTNCPAHLLNVTASKMSIDENNQCSLVEWLRLNAPSYSDNDFIPRMLYREYLNDCLIAAERCTSGKVELSIISDSVTEIKRSNDGLYEIKSSSGVCYSSKQVLLAIGNSLAPNRGAPLNSPWDLSALQRASKTASVALIGTGLTAIDAIVGLEHYSFNGHFTLISRKGLLPEPHVAENENQILSEQTLARLRELSSLRSCLKVIRSEIAQGVPWRTLIDAIRPLSHKLWQQFTLAEKQRFLRHLRPLWTSHRHRVPAKSYAHLQQLINNNRITIVREEIGIWHQQEGGIILQSKRSDRKFGPYQHVFDCMGIWNNAGRCQCSILENIIQSDLGCYDELMLGLRADGIGRLLSSKGKHVPGLYTLGSLRRGDLWESTAVREIRRQAAEIVADVMTLFKN